MGIVRLAKNLRLLNSIDEYDNRNDDTKNKISGNRVYMDFVSIVYQIQQIVSLELNYLLYSFMLAHHKTLDSTEYNDPKFKKMMNKYYNDQIISLESNNDISKLIDKIDKTYIDQFKNFVRSNNNINKFIYRDVIHFIIDMLTQKITDVEYIYIAFDGIPSFGKIQEQRHRRYMRYSFSEFDKNLINESNDPLRFQYDQDHFTINIKKAIEYVYDMSNSNILSKDIQDGISKYIKKKVTVEIINEPYGEGEKMLMDKLINDSKKPEYQNSSYVFYSPDGDSVILCLYIYIHTKLDKLVVVKTYKLNPSKIHNEQSQYVDIKKLYHNIPKTIQKYFSKTKSTNIKLFNVGIAEMDSMARDYILLMCLYGNDFIHQIPTMEISCTSMDLLYIYANFIQEHGFILRVSTTTTEHNKIKIHPETFVKFISTLAEYEQYLMMDTYLYEVNYKSRIFKTFGEIFPFRYLYDYVDKVRDIRDRVFKHGILPQNEMNNLTKIATMSGTTYASIFTKYEIVDVKNKQLKMPRFIYDIKIKPNKGDKIYELVNIKMNDVKSIYEDKNNNKNNDDLFDIQTIRLNIPHNQMPITKKDIDLYLIEWKSGKWRKLLNASPYNFGYNYHTKQIINIEDEMKRYEEYFLHNANIHQMVREYLETLSWIVDYYMNNIDFDQNKKFISTWSYRYDRSPFINHINNVISKLSYKQITEIMDNAYNRNCVNIKDYLTESQHKFYIYPHTSNEIYKIPQKYQKSFPDMDKYVKSVVNQTDRPFDCRLSSYFSKCLFRSKHLTFNQYKKICSKL